MAYAYQSVLETKIKCYIMLGVILVSCIGYTTCEFLVSKELTQKLRDAADNDSAIEDVVNEVLEAPKDVGRQRGQSFISQKSAVRSRKGTTNKGAEV